MLFLSDDELNMWQFDECSQTCNDVPFICDAWIELLYKSHSAQKCMSQTVTTKLQSFMKCCQSGIHISLSAAVVCA